MLLDNIALLLFRGTEKVYQNGSVKKKRHEVKRLSGQRPGAHPGYHWAY